MENIDVEMKQILAAMNTAGAELKESKAELEKHENYMNQLKSHLHETETVLEQNKKTIEMNNYTKSFINEQTVTLRHTAEQVYNCIPDIYKDLTKESDECQAIEERCEALEKEYAQLDARGRLELMRLDALKADLFENYNQKMKCNKNVFQQLIEENGCLQNEMNASGIERTQFQNYAENELSLSFTKVESLESEIKLLQVQILDVQTEEASLVKIVEEETQSVENTIEDLKRKLAIENEEIAGVEIEALIMTKTIDETTIYNEQLLRNNEEYKKLAQNWTDKLNELTRSDELIDEEMKIFEEYSKKECDLKVDLLKTQENEWVNENQIIKSVNQEMTELSTQMQVIKVEIDTYKNILNKLEKSKLMEEERVEKSNEELDGNNNSITNLSKEVEQLRNTLGNQEIELTKIEIECDTNIAAFSEESRLNQIEFDETYERLQNEVKATEQRNNEKQNLISSLQLKLNELSVDREKAITQRNTDKELDKLLSIQCDNVLNEVRKLRNQRMSSKILKANSSLRKLPKPSSRTVRNALATAASTSKEKVGIEFDSSDFSSIDGSYYETKDFYKKKRSKK